MQLKYVGSKAWLAPYLDRLLGDVAVLHSPFSGSGKLEYYPRRPASGPGGAQRRRLRARRKPAPLLLEARPGSCAPCCALVGRRVDRRFYFSRLLPGALRGRVGRRAACSYVLLRVSSPVSSRAAHLVARPTVSAFLFCRGSTAASRVKTSITTRPYFGSAPWRPTCPARAAEAPAPAGPSAFSASKAWPASRRGRAASQVGTASAGHAR